MASTAVKLFVALLAVHLSCGDPCNPHHSSPPYHSPPPCNPIPEPCATIPLPHQVPPPHVPPPHVSPHYPSHPVPEPCATVAPCGPNAEPYGPYPDRYPFYPQPYYPLFSTHTTSCDVPPCSPQPENYDVFPKGFSFGVTSGAYHHEGAWNQDWKEESIWDRWLHTVSGITADCSNGDYSADSYNHIKEDVEILNNLTVRHYRFSIPWSAVIFGGVGEINEVGLAHYRNLVHILRLYQIEPIVTIYHGDLPQVLQDQGGFLCSSFPEWYAYYANVLFENLGCDVKYWITFNDPTAICKQGYGDGTYAPGIGNAPGYNEYLCGHNLLKAHAAAYHNYDDNYRCTQNGKISIALASDWYEPRTWCETDIYASETKLEFQLGWWAHPIYVGDYPCRMREKIPYDCYGQSRLPVFSHSEIEYIKNTHDFFALNYISAYYVTLAGKGYYGNTCYNDDVGVEIVPCDGPIVTEGIRKLLGWIKDHYYNPSVFITSTGYSKCTRCLEDYDRIDWIKAILRNIRKSMIEDDTRVYGFSYYSYIDGFEWLDGYTTKFGLYDVDFECPTRPRTPRKSAEYYQHLSSTGCIDDPCPGCAYGPYNSYGPYPIYEPYDTYGPYPAYGPYPSNGPYYGSYPYDTDGPYPRGPYPNGPFPLGSYHGIEPCDTVGPYPHGSFPHGPYHGVEPCDTDGPYPHGPYSHGPFPHGDIDGPYPYGPYPNGPYPNGPFPLGSYHGIEPCDTVGPYPHGPYPHGSFPNGPYHGVEPCDTVGPYPHGPFPHGDIDGPYPHGPYPHGSFPNGPYHGVEPCNTDGPYPHGPYPPHGPSPHGHIP